MRQVPKYCLIGNGKMSTHFASYLDYLNIHYTLLSRSELNHHSIQFALRHYDKICLLITDSSISSLINQYHMNNKNKLVHFSGALTIKECWSAHPLMTFGHQLYDSAQYQSFPFIIEAEGPPFDELLPGIPNKHYRIPQHLKSYYHSLCVMSGNFSAILWHKCFESMKQDLQIDEEAIKPYLLQVFNNIADDHHKALTGPLARQDLITIQKNKAALAEKEDPFLNIYEQFVTLFTKQAHK